MAELLLELLSEEIPAHRQRPAIDALSRNLATELTTHALPFESVHGFVTPRRLAFQVEGLALVQKDRVEEKRGPKVGAPDQAIQGFLAAQGLDHIDQCSIREVKGTPYYFARLEYPGRPGQDVLRQILPVWLDHISWPQSMRWDHQGGRWIRPLRHLLCVFEGEVLDITYRGLTADNTSFGHRIHAPQPFSVTNFATYQSGLKQAYVLLDSKGRQSRILEHARALATQYALDLCEDESLIEEIAGLVEWPVALMGKFDPACLDLPGEVLAAEMRHHQKYLALRDQQGHLAPCFIVIANLEAPDGGETILKGNERVLRARLADARFFWDRDRQHSLESRLPDLAGRIFHAKLGHMQDKAHRLSRLAGLLAPLIPGAERRLAERAGLLAKADLTCGMVEEFPQLQGIMGGYYALHDGEPDIVAGAIASHYRPSGPEDSCPEEPVALAVALADKIDTLSGFFAIGETPTGSRDPYSLRRAASGVVRMIDTQELRLPLRRILALAQSTDPQPLENLLGFMTDRLRYHLRENGFRADHIAAILATGDDDIIRIKARLQALDEFLKSDAGNHLLMMYERAHNIVVMEETRDKVSYQDPPDRQYCREPEEIRLLEECEAAEIACQHALKQENFVAAMQALAPLHQPMDAFFEQVTVNSQEADLRNNRLRILARIRAILDQVASFSHLQDSSPP